MDKVCKFAGEKERGNRMINIYTAVEKIPQSLTILENINEKFDVVFSPDMLDEIDLNFMKKIDEAEFIDKQIGTIKTKFGVTNYTELSTGCKTAIYTNHILKSGSERKYCINANNCGGNALKLMFSAFKDKSLFFLLEHPVRCTDIFDRKVCVNGEEVNYKEFFVDFEKYLAG